MGRTFRTAVLALVVAAAVSGCGGDPDPEAQIQEAAQEYVTEMKAFCEAAAANVEARGTLEEFARAGGGGRPADQVSAAVEPVRASTAALVETAPEEVRPDAEAAVSPGELKLAVFEATGGDGAAAEADPGYQAKAAEVAEQASRFRQFIRTSCRIDA